ncbi:MAG: hypothetical protein JNK91_08995 [Ferruginibacter sp.]|nr:hypothetical protein [Ferruginibacter sp.]
MRILLIISTLFIAAPALPAVAQTKTPETFIVVLGIAQDAGYPQLGCTRECCAAYWNKQQPKKHCTALAVVDRASNQYWLIEATPDIREQLQTLQSYLPNPGNYKPDGVFLTHAHMGHYTGLLQFGREAMGAGGIPVWTMPRMKEYLRSNGPWSQLVLLNNIALRSLANDSTIILNASLRITPLQVPHRDEYSETVGFRIESGSRSILFIPDIDKWTKWNRNLAEEIKKSDMALLDGTFFANGELPGRDMKEIPHPFVTETMELLAELPASEKNKIVFIHFNHTNPLIRQEKNAMDNVKAQGMQVASEGMIIGL